MRFLFDLCYAWAETFGEFGVSVLHGCNLYSSTEYIHGRRDLALIVASRAGDDCYETDWFPSKRHQVLYEPFEIEVRFESDIFGQRRSTLN